MGKHIYQTIFSLEATLLITSKNLSQSSYYFWKMPDPSMWKDIEYPMSWFLHNICIEPFIIWTGGENVGFFFHVF